MNVWMPTFKTGEQWQVCEHGFFWWAIDFLGEFQMIRQGFHMSYIGPTPAVPFATREEAEAFIEVAPLHMMLMNGWLP